MVVTPERFEELAQAFGADIARWPQAQQSAARRYAAREPAAVSVLQAAARLDGLLDAAPRVVLGASMRERIVRAAPTPARRAWRWVTGAGVGAVLAAACAGGVAVGMFVIPTEVVTSAAHNVLMSGDDALGADLPDLGDAR
jgi:hypothetical protein